MLLNTCRPKRVALARTGKTLGHFTHHFSFKNPLNANIDIGFRRRVTANTCQLHSESAYRNYNAKSISAGLGFTHGKKSKQERARKLHIGRLHAPKVKVLQLR